MRPPIARRNWPEGMAAGTISALSHQDVAGMDWKSDYLRLRALKTAEGGAAAEQLIALHMPSSLFKYRAVSELAIDAFEKESVWVASPASCNDPYDCQLTYDPHQFIHRVANNASDDRLRELLPMFAKFSAEELNEFRQSASFLDAALARLVKQHGVPAETFAAKKGEMNATFAKVLAGQAATVRDSFVFCSFSTRADSTLMWSHYAENHYGFCIEYDVPNLTANPHLRNALFPVEYGESMADITDAMVANFVSNMPINVLNVGLRKAMDWAYEDEWRLLFPSKSWRPQLVGVTRPKRVLLGSRFVDSAGSLGARLLALCDQKEIPTVRMQLDDRTYRMRPVG